MILEGRNDGSGSKVRTSNTNDQQIVDIVINRLGNLFDFKDLFFGIERWNIHPSKEFISWTNFHFEILIGKIDLGLQINNFLFFKKIKKVVAIQFQHDNFRKLN